MTAEYSRCGKAIGSNRMPMDRWYTRPHGDRWGVHAPSGAWITTWDTEAEALDEAARQNEMWGA